MQCQFGETKFILFDYLLHAFVVWVKWSRNCCFGIKCDWLLTSFFTGLCGVVVIGRANYFIRQCSEILCTLHTRAAHRHWKLTQTDKADKNSLSIAPNFAWLYCPIIAIDEVEIHRKTLSKYSDIFKKPWKISTHMLQQPPFSQSQSEKILARSCLWEQRKILLFFGNCRYSTKTGRVYWKFLKCFTSVHLLANLQRVLHSTLASFSLCHSHWNLVEYLLSSFKAFPRQLLAVCVTYRLAKQHH